MHPKGLANPTARCPKVGDKELSRMITTAVTVHPSTDREAMMDLAAEVEEAVRRLAPSVLGPVVSLGLADHSIACLVSVPTTDVAHANERAVALITTMESVRDDVTFPQVVTELADDEVLAAV